MKPSAMEDLSKILDLLRELDSQAISDNVSCQHLEIVLAKDQNEDRLNGNAEGLIYLSRVFLEVAVKDKAGSHIHIDETGVADRCDIPMVVSLKDSIWEN